MSILFTLKGELDGWMIVDALVRKLRGFEAKRQQMNNILKEVLSPKEAMAVESSFISEGITDVHFVLVPSSIAGKIA